MSYPRVKIVQTRPRNIQGYSSALEYWRHSTGSDRKRCCAIGCSREIQDCAIVQVKEAGHGNEWQLLPFCSYHLRFTDEIPVEIRSNLVRENQKFVNRDPSSKTTKLSKQPQHPQLLPFPEDPHHRQQEQEHSYVPQYQQSSQTHPQLLPFPEYVRQEPPQNTCCQEQRSPSWEPQPQQQQVYVVNQPPPQQQPQFQQPKIQESQQDQGDLSLSSMIDEALSEYNNKQKNCKDEDQNRREALTLIIKIILMFFYWLGVKICGLFSQKPKTQ